MCKFIKNLSLSALVLQFINCNVHSMNVNIVNNDKVQNNKIKTYEINIKNTNDCFQVSLPPANASQCGTNTDINDNNTYTLKEICDTNPNRKMQYTLYFIQNMEKLLQILKKPASNAQEIVDKAINNSIKQMKDSNFVDKSITISENLAALLNYKDRNNIKLTKLLLDIKSKINNLYKNIISDEAVKNYKKLVEDVYEKASPEFYEGGYKLPNNNNDKTIDEDPYLFYRDNYLNSSCKMKFNNVY